MPTQAHPRGMCTNMV